MPNKKSATSSSDRNRWVVIGAGALLVVVAAAAAYVFVFSGDGGSNKRPSALAPTPVVIDSTEAKVEVLDNTFKAPAIQVKVGTTVTWQFKGKISHTVTSIPGTGPRPATATSGDATPAKEFKFDSGGRVTGEYSFTFDTPGTYEYFCTVHHVMQGKVVVTA